MKYISLIIFTTFIFVFLLFGLYKKDKTLNTPLLNKPVPEINLSTLNDKNLNENDFKNEILLVNFLRAGASLALRNMIFYLN